MESHHFYSHLEPEMHLFVRGEMPRPESNPLKIASQEKP